ncbi:protein Wnt-6-like isoform X2 [Watersipora subatra]|uniref:protein Wnt-6-like isoform X2 n=1 Tax=Watersipora subatra TaxID=2589382 RepID=UPI00355C3A3B
MRADYSTRFLFLLLFGVNLLSGLLSAGSYNLDTNEVCQKSRKANMSKKNPCRKQPQLRREVEMGKQLAIETCQQNFADHRWNCTTTHSSFRRIMKTDTREAAYLNAITAAGILYSVTQACSMGVLWQCHCDRTIRDVSEDEMWSWGGCSDDIIFGYNKSKQFTKTKHISTDIKGLIRNHNNEAGRLAITENMKKSCKCHGLSGSCTLRTCWLNMPQFSDVGKSLRERYDGAPKVIGDNDGKTLIPEKATIKPPTTQDLVYTEESPDFCVPNKKYGTNGTVGRFCNGTSYNHFGTDACDILCCNRGFERKTFEIKKKCSCKFVWCCEVVCDICHVNVTVHLCK